MKLFEILQEGYGDDAADAIRELDDYTWALKYLLPAAQFKKVFTPLKDEFDDYDADDAFAFEEMTNKVKSHLEKVASGEEINAALRKVKNEKTSLYN